MFAKCFGLALAVLLISGTGVVVAQEPRGEGDAKPRITVIPSANQAELARQREASHTVQRKLRETRLDFSADGEPLDKALAKIGEILEVEIDLRRLALRDSGISAEDPVSIELRGVRAETLLELILTPLSLVAVADADRVVVTTTEQLESRWFTTRYYPLKDLMTDQPDDADALDADSLIEVLTTVIAPDCWEELGGPGTVSVFGSGLVITQSPENQRLIELLFAALREAKDLSDDQYRIEPLIVATDPQEFGQTAAELRLTKVSLSAEAMPLADIVAHFASESGINFVIEIPDHADIEVDGQWQEKSVMQVLNQLANDYHFAWTIQNGVINLHALDQRHDPSRLLVAVYPLRDLVASQQALLKQLTNPWTQVPAHRIQSGMSGMGCGFSPKYGAMGVWPVHPYHDYDPNQPDYNDLIMTLTGSLVPDSWEELGGAGTIAEFELAECLVITQTWEMHEKVEDLLAQIRANVSVNEIPPTEPREDHLLIRSYYAQAHRQTGELLIQRDDLRDLTERMKTLIDEDSWEDEGVFVQVLDDRVIIRQRGSVHDQIGPFFAATNVVVRLPEGGLWEERSVTGLRFVPQRPPAPAVETKSP